MHRVRGFSDYSDRMRNFTERSQGDYLRESQQALIDDERDKKFEIAQRKCVDRYSDFWKSQPQGGK